MRKLVYVGINKVADEMVETTSYEKMVEYRNKGFVFHDRMEDIVPEREPLDKYKERMKKRDRKIREKRAAALA